MNPPVALWGVLIGICLAVSAVNLGIWLRAQSRSVLSDRGMGFLLVGATSLTLVFIGYFEIRLMTLSTAAEGIGLLQRAHGFVFVMFVCMAWFVHDQLGTGRTWLLGTFLALRLAVLIANFAGPGNIHYLEATTLRTVPFLGGQVTLLEATVGNPWGVLVPLSTLVFTLYVVDASARLWRTGDAVQRQRAALVGGSLVLAVMSSTLVSVLKNQGVLEWPFMATPSFVFVVLAIAYALVVHLLRSSELAEELLRNRSELQQVERRLLMATQAAGIGSWEWNRTRDEFHLSAPAQDLLGLHGAQPIDSDLFFSRFRPEDRLALRAVMEGVDPKDGELDTFARVSDPSGRPRWIVLRGTYLEAGRTQERTLRGVLADVTRRKDHDESLSAVANASPIGIAMVNRSGLIAFANRKLEELFGYGPGEMMGLPVDTLVPEALRGHHARLREGYFNAGGSRAMLGGRDVTGRRKDGGAITIEVSLVQETLRGETVTLVSVIDQGWRREAERELAKQRDELALLSRAALLGELSGSLAHELNQPLTSVLINAQATQQLLEQGRLEPATLQEILVDIVNDTRRAGEVIRRLRMLLRHGQAVMERVDLEAIVREVLKLLNSDLIERHVTVHTRFESGTPPVIGDRVQLQQVVLNLLLNACEAMAESDRPRQIWVEVHPSDRSEVRLLVKDEGMGIPPDRLGQIFEAFVTTKSEGLGLGLSLCRRIIEHHGGAIIASNTDTGGAAFEFSLPRAPEAVR